MFDSDDQPHTGTRRQVKATREWPVFCFGHTSTDFGKKEKTHRPRYLRIGVHAYVTGRVAVSDLAGAARGGHFFAENDLQESPGTKRVPMHPRALQKANR
jgi:hypothetical protein